MWISPSLLKAKARFICQDITSLRIPTLVLLKEIHSENGSMIKRSRTGISSFSSCIYNSIMILVVHWTFLFLFEHVEAGTTRKQRMERMSMRTKWEKLAKTLSRRPTMKSCSIHLFSIFTRMCHQKLGLLTSICNAAKNRDDGSKKMYATPPPSRNKNKCMCLHNIKSNFFIS